MCCNNIVFVQGEPHAPDIEDLLVADIKWPTAKDARDLWKFRRGGRSHFVPAFQVEDRTAAKICALSHKGTRPQGVDRLGSRRHLVTVRGAPGGAARVPGY